MADVNTTPRASVPVVKHKQSELSCNDFFLFLLEKKGKEKKKEKNWISDVKQQQHQKANNKNNQISKHNNT